MPPQPKKRPPLDEIAKRFHLPLMKAAEDLGICQTLLKKFCRQYGIARWPYRKMKSMYMNGNEQVDAQAIEAYINQSTTPGSGGNNNSSSSGHFNDGEDLGDDDEDSEIVHHQQQHYQQQQQQQHYSHNSQQQQQQPQQHYSQNSHHHHQQQQQGSYVTSPQQQQQQPYSYQQQPQQQQSQHHSQYQYPQPYSRHLSSQHQKSHHQQQQQQQGSGQSSYDYRGQSVHNNDERRNSSSSQQQQRFSSNGNSNSSTGGSTTSGSFSFDQLKSSPFQSNNNNSNNNGNRDNTNNNNSRVSQLPMSPKNVHLIPPVQPYHPSSNNAVVPASSSNSTPNTPTVYPASPPSSTSSALSPSNHNLSSSHHNINHNNNNNNNNSSHMHDVSVGPHPTQRGVSLHTSGASQQQQQQESRDRIYPQPSNPLFRSYSSPSNLQFGDNFKQQHQQQHGNHHQHHQHHQHQHHGSQHHASRHSLSPVHPSRKLERSKTLSFDHAPPAHLSHTVPPRSQPTSPDYSSSSVRDSSSQQARPSHIPPLQIPSNGNGPQSTLSPQQQQASSHYGYNHQSIQNVGRTNSSSSTSSNNSSFANNSVPSFSFGFSSQTVTPEEHSQMYGNVEVTTVNSPVSSPRGSDEMSPVSSPVLSFEQFRLSSPTSPPASSKNTLVHHGSHQHLGSYANNSNNNHNNQSSHSNNNGINNSNNGSTNGHKSKHGILSSIDSTMRNLFRSKSFTAIPRHQKPTSLENPHNNHMGTSIASKDNLLNHPPPMTRTGSGTLNTTRHPYPSSLKSIGRAYSSECISPTTHSHPSNHFMNSGVSNISADIQSQQPPKLQKLPSINQLFGPIDHLHAKRPSKELHAVESGMLDGQSGFSHHNSGTFTPIQANTRPDSPMRDSQSPNFEPSNTRPSALHNTQLQFSGGNWNNSRSQYQNHYS